MTKDEAIEVLQTSRLAGCAFYPEDTEDAEEMEAALVLVYHGIAELRAGGEIYVPDLSRL